LSANRLETVSFGLSGSRDLGGWWFPPNSLWQVQALSPSSSRNTTRTETPFAKNRNDNFQIRRWKTMAKTSFTPLHDRILVRRIEEGESKVGGIIIPDSAKEKPQQGEVISVGKGKSNDEGKVFPLDVKAGDTILFGKYSGTEIKLDGEELLIMREEEVLGIIKK
jgi:chaperonin GroES